MLNRKIINEDEPLKKNISNINNIRDPNISIQSNLDFISDRPMTEFSHLNNINNEITNFLYFSLTLIGVFRI